MVENRGQATIVKCYALHTYTVLKESTLYVLSYISSIPVYYSEWKHEIDTVNKEEHQNAKLFLISNKNV